MRWRSLGLRLSCATVAMIAAIPAGVRSQAPSTPSPGNGTLYVGSFAGHFSVIDEATSTIVGKIPFKSGIPRRTSLSRDRTRFYTIEADMDKVEIIDIVSRTTLDVFSLSEGNKTVRIKTVEPDPKHRFVVLVTRAATKLADRFEIGPAELVQYDLAAHKVTRIIPWPNGEERESANIQFSPDGRSMYLFNEQDVLIYDTESFAQVGKWDMSKAPEEGLGSIRFGSTDSINDEPGFYTGLFTVEDPVQHRRMMGIGRVNLAARSVDFSVLGPASQVGFTMSPDRRVAFGLSSEIGRYEFWKFDLATKQVAERVEFKGRPRMSLRTSSNGRVLYIYNAGATIDLWDAATYRFMKTIQLPGDHTTELFVFPEDPRRPAASRTDVLDRDLRRALAFVVPYWRRLVLVLAISAASTALTLYLPLLSRDFVDRALIGRDAPYLFRIAFTFAGATALGFVLNVVSGLRYTRVSADILFDMRLEMYRHLQRLSPRFYARVRLGDIMSRINSDIGEIQRMAAEAALAWVGNGFFLAGTIGMLAWLDLRLFLVTAVTAPLALLAAAYYRKKLEREIAVMRERSADIGSFLIETLQAMRLVVTANAQAREALRFREKNQAFIRALMSMQWLSYLSGGLPGLILSAVTGVVFVYGGLRVVQGTLTVGTFIAFMAYNMRFLPTLEALMGFWTNLATARVSLRRVAEVLDARIEVEERPNADVLPVSRGELTFERVTLSFDRGGPAVDDLSFRVGAGEILAVVGPSGSGKSTVADLAVRLLDPDAGVIRLDGRDIRTLRLEDLRRHIGVVDQSPCILHASIADNIRYAKPDAGDEEVRLAARRAALAPFIDRLPDGYDTVVGERGAALSAGERQRIAVARAFLADPAILILDEPTAALDPRAECDLVWGLADAMAGRTTVIITHRMEVANRADRILVLEPCSLPVAEAAPGHAAA